MPAKEPFDWDKGLQHLNQEVDAQQMWKQAEMLRDLEADFGSYVPKEHPKAVREFLSSNESLTRSALSVMLLDWDAYIDTYEYRGDFMVVGLTECKKFSYNVCYFPSSPEKAGKIYLTINHIENNCATVASNILPLRPPTLD